MSRKKLALIVGAVLLSVSMVGCAIRPVEKDPWAFGGIAGGLVLIWGMTKEPGDKD